MQGFIYIAGSFTDITLPKNKADWRDNDPHFWTDPPTWGICRPDIRERANRGDFIFFVLPKASRLPQTIFAFMQIEDKVPHLVASARPELVSKQMSNVNPNGNIIVNPKGGYNRFDHGAHKKGFHRIKKNYAVGSSTIGRLLSEPDVHRLAPGFLPKLNAVLGTNASSAIDAITRAGRTLDNIQVAQLLAWLG